MCAVLTARLTDDVLEEPVVVAEGVISGQHFVYDSRHLLFGEEASRVDASVPHAPNRVRSEVEWLSVVADFRPDVARTEVVGQASVRDVPCVDAQGLLAEEPGHLRQVGVFIVAQDEHTPVGGQFNTP